MSPVEPPVTEMTPAEAVFFAAAALPAADRAGYLARACVGNDDLRRQVERMIAARAEVGDFLEPPPCDATATFGHGDDPAQTADFPRRDENVGGVIGGKYTLVESVGEGGMGSVWRAKQTEPVKRFVAVKLIKAGMDSKQVLARFEAERQALALMDHPNIARVLDGGLHDGRPYFVMELVKGVPVTDFCDARKLTPKERLELFVQVCQAVQHAHQKGVIHRDLKPSNVLVALYDDRPVVKVIDFGVAKATGAALTERTIDTGFGGVVGTPEYMSPEQATFNNLDVDTRSDVYALGVLLYELLTGSPPFARKELEKRGLLEMLRVVREEEPPRPSTKLSTAAALPTLSANRGSDPKKLTGLLRNELDWVVMKALEKDRARRYETATAFAADVQRYLGGEAVQAHPPSAGYRLRKFVRRNKGRVAAAGLVLVALLCGIAGTTLGLIEARRQEEEARKQERIARDETAEKEMARLAEAERVRERDAALKGEAERADELKYRLGISDMVLAVAAYDNRDVVLAAERLEKVPPAQRGWEWRHLKQQTRGGLFTLHGHKGPVVRVAFSPDGTRVATAAQLPNSSLAELKLWDARTGTGILELHDLTEAQTQNGASQVFTLGGTRLATIGRDNTVQVWDARTGKLQRELKHATSVSRVCLSPDGARLATLALDGQVRVWDAEAGEPRWEVKAESTALVFSPDGTRIVTGTGKDVGKVWDARTGKHLVEITGCDDPLGLAFSPDGKRIVAGGRPRAKVWDAEKGGQPLPQFKPPASSTSCLSFSPDSTRILLGSNQPTAQVCDATTGALAFTARGRWQTGAYSLYVSAWGDGEYGAAFSPDGTRIVIVGGQTGADEATVFDARTGAELLVLTGHTGKVLCAAFSPDGTQIVTGCADGTAKVWDARAGTPRLELNTHFGDQNLEVIGPDGVRTPGPFVEVNVTAFSPDGARVLFAGMVVSGSEGRRGGAMVCDARTGVPLLYLKGLPTEVRSAAFSPDGARIVTGGYSLNEVGDEAKGEAKVWDAHTGAELFELKGLQAGVNNVAFSPDGTRVVTAGASPPTVREGENELKVWDARTGALLLDLTRQVVPGGGGLDHKGSCVAFSPDGTRFVSGGHRWRRGPVVAVRDAATGAELFELKGHPGSLECVAYSPDGTRIVTGLADYYRKALVWDARTGGQLLELKGHTSGVLCAAFSPDGTRIVTAGGDKTVRVWDARTGTELLMLRSFGDRVTSVAFSPDGTRIVTGERFGAVKVWDARPDKEPPDAEELAYRRLCTEPNVRRYLAGYREAQLAADGFAARFYLDRLIALSVAANQPDEVKKWRAERIKFPDIAPLPREKK